MISRNICKTAEFPDADFYTVICDCTHDDDNISMIMEVEDGMITLTFYKKIWAKATSCSIFPRFELAKDWYGRFKIAWNVLTKGYAEYEAEFLMQNEQAIDDLITALSESKIKMKLQQEEDRKKYCTLDNVVQ
jgi:hypothetical protein